jgi:Putative prokaryotic signal transducing protein
MARRAKVIRFPKSPEPAPGLVEVLRCRDQSEALVARGLLESEGIQVVLRSNLAQSVYPFSVGRQAEVILLALREDVARARSVLTRR